MLQRLKELLPLNWRIYFRNRKGKRLLKKERLPVNDVFSKIYAENKWGNSESVSGPGSQKAVTQHLIEPLNNLMNRREIQSLLDLPCGDCNWIFGLDLQQRQYIGGDVVPELVERMQSEHAGNNREFLVMDILSDSLPKADLLLCRDCFVHLSNELIMQSLQNIKRSDIRYIALTHFPDFPRNYDIPTGQWRPVNLQLAPYNLPAPEIMIEEWFPEGTDKRYRKVLALWEEDQFKKI